MLYRSIGRDILPQQRASGRGSGCSTPTPIRAARLADTSIGDVREFFLDRLLYPLEITEDVPPELDDLAELDGVWARLLERDPSST